MNLSDFFTPSLERGLEHKNLLKMPPRSKEGPVVYENENTGLARYHQAHQQQLAQELRMENSRERGRLRENASSRSPAEVTIFVGRNRASYTICAESLRQSTYFSSLLDKRIQEPIIVDCDESVFQNMMLILRYGSFEALPRMSDSDLFRLKTELEIHGIEVPENVIPRKESSCPIVAGSGNLSSPSSLSTTSSKSSYQQQQLLARVVQQQQQHSSILALPDFPDELKDSSKIVLVARIDDDERGRCTCTPKGQHCYWALSFHYRHAFCTGCGKSASTVLSPRFVAEIYMAAAIYYSGENVTNKQKWSVGCDSTCSLKLLTARPCCLCPSCSLNSKTSDVWAVSTYHSHAFCTRCGQSANDQTLVCILLTLRYGGISKSTRLRREHSNGSSENVTASSSSSSDVVVTPKLFSTSNSSSSRTTTRITTTEFPHHTRSNKSL